MATDEIKQTIVIEANISTIQNDLKTLEAQFKTSFANIGSAGVESFASIDAASRKFQASQAAAAAATTTGGFKNISTLAAANLAGGASRAQSATSGVKSDAVEFARFEKIRQDALTASRAAFKDFEDSVRTGARNAAGSFAATASSATGLTSSMGSLLAVAKSIGLVFSVGFAFGFVKEALNATGALNDLADQTGFTGETLLKLKPIANDAGSSIEDFARSVNQFQKAIIEGSPATVEALHKIGLTANELLKFADDPEGLIGKLSKGLASIADQATRVQVKRDLLARGGPRLAALFDAVEKRGGIEGIQAEKPLISNEQIAAIDRLGAAFDNAKISLQALAAVRIVEVFDLFINIGKAVDLVIAKIDKLRNLLPAFGPTREDVAALIAQNKKASEVPQSPQEALDAAKQSTTTPSDIAKATVGPTETDTQRDFKKSLDEQIDSLKTQVVGLTQSKDAQIANAAAALVHKAALIDLTTADAKFVEKLEEFKRISKDLSLAQFSDSLLKNAHATEVQIAAMTQGESAAEALALKYQLEDAKLGSLNKTIVDGIANQKRLNQARAEAPVAQAGREFEEQKNANLFTSQILGPTFNRGEADRQALQDQINKLLKLAASTNPGVAKLAQEVLIELKPKIDPASLKAIQEDIGIAIGKNAEFAPLLNANFGNTVDEAAANVDKFTEALQKAKDASLSASDPGVIKIAKDLDQAKFSKATSDLNRDLALADAQAAIFGRSFDLAGARVQAVESNVNGLLTQGLKPSTEEAQRLGEQLRNLKVANIFSDLQKNFEDIRADAEILGGAVDLPSESVNALTDALKRLRAQGFKPLSPEIQDLKAQLEDAKAAEHFAEAFQGIGSSFIGALQDLADGGKIKDVAKRLASNINRAITDALITRPFEEWIKKQTNDLFGPLLKLPIPGAGAGQSVSAPGAALTQVAQGSIFSTFPNAPAIAQTAIQAIVTEATTVIQTASVEAQMILQAVSAETTTAIQVSGTTAETAITTLAATAEASITALQAVAIAAIEAASAGQGGASLFSGGTAAAGASTFSEVGAGEIFSKFPVGHSGGKIDANLPIRRLHTGGAISPAIDAVQLSKVAHSTFARFHTGGAVGPTDNSSHLTNITDATEANTALSHFHVGGAINLSHLTVQNVARETMPRFHDGGKMWNGGKMAGGDLKPGERVIIAEDGEYVIKKQTALKIGHDKLEKLNRDQALIVPKMHVGGTILSTFHQGGAVLRTTIINHAAALSLPKFHNGGDVSATERWAGTSADLSSLSRTGTIADDALITTGMSRRQSANGPSANIANFYNPQFQDRRSVGQTAANLTAAMESGKRNR